MDFKKRITEELKLSKFQVEIFFDEYINVCEKLAKEYHQKQLTIGGVSKSFALGKEAIIVECFKGHEFEDGELVEIVEKFDNELWIVKSKETGKEWYITEEEANVC